MIVDSLLMILLAEMPDWLSTSLSLILTLAIGVVIIASAIAFFRGPATAADRHAEGLSSQFNNPADAALFFSLYRSKKPKSTLAAWLFTIFLSPTISYVYQGRWSRAIIALVTLQGLGLWWIISWFTMPSEVAKANMELADEAFNQVLLARPGAAQTPAAMTNPAPLAPSEKENSSTAQLSS